MPELPDRTCGGCTACCYTHSVQMDGVTTGFYSLCSHCTVGVGCAIYDSRPRSCRVYQCLWRATDMRDELRPDRSGVIFDTWTFESIPFTFLLVWEVEEGASAKYPMSEVIEGLFASNKYIIWNIGASDNALRFPEGVAEEVKTLVHSEFADVIQTVAPA